MNAPTVGTVLVFANTTGSFTTPTGPGAGFTGNNTDYSLAANYPAVGGNLVYAGTGANFAVTGLSTNQNYSFKAYSYTGSDWSSGTAIITGSATTQPVTSTVVAAGSGSLQLSWTNPSSTACYNNVIVIARQGSPVEAALSKANFDGLVDDNDFTGANATWTSNSNSNDVFDLTSSLVGTDNTNFLVYKGTGNSVTLNGLTNGTPYYFRVFTIDGNGLDAKWGNGIDANGTPDVPGYYWNGGSIPSLPANGGSGTWGTTNAWRQPGASGAQSTWVNGNPAIFAGNAGVVTLDADITATSYLFNTSSYTLETTSSTSRNLFGPLTIGNNNALVIAPNFTGTTNGTMGFGSISGTGSASLTIYGNQIVGSAARINLASANSTISVPTNIVSASGTGGAGYVATSTGGFVNGNITNNSSLTTIIGATSGNDLTVNSTISGSGSLMFAGGASGGAGTVNLNAVNNYSGQTIFNAANSGVIKLGINNSLPVTTDVTMAFSASNGGILDLNGFNQSIGNIANGAGGGSITNNSAASNSTLTITQTTLGSFNRPITDGPTRKLAIEKNGSNTLTLNGTGYTFSGGLKINSGEMRFNPSASPVNIASCPVTLNGGSLGTSGIAVSSVLNYSTLNVADNSTISLGTANSHTLNFVVSNALSWTPSKTLTITGWQGTYTTTAGSPGTKGRIVVGTSTTALTGTQLSQIKFYDGSVYYSATLLSNGELVPGSSSLTQLSTAFCAYTATSTTEFIWADSLGTPTTQNNYRYKFKLINGASTLTWTTNNQWPIMQFYLIPGYLPATTYTTSVAWSSDFGATFSVYGPTCTLTSPGAPSTKLTLSSCGSSPASYNTLIYADVVPNATQYEYRFSIGTNSVTSLQKSNNNFILSQLTGLANGTTYSVDVRVTVNSIVGNYGNVCTITAPAGPTTSLSAGSCGSSPTSNNTLLFADIVNGATQYQYRFSIGTNSVTSLVKSNNNFILSQLTGLTNSTTYSLDVRALFNSTWQSYGPVCTITTPGAPTTQMQPTSCNIAATSYTNQLLRANIVDGATQYEFVLTNASLGYSVSLIKSNNNFILNQFAGLQNSTTYSVQVRINYNSIWGAFGPICTLQTPATFMKVINTNVALGDTESSELAKELAAINAVNKFDAISYPNPYNQSFGLSLTSYNVNEKVNITVFDATGKLIEQHSLTPNELSNLNLGAQYPAGIYNIVVSQAGKAKSIKVVKP
jgi:autotransporter-associated beta strand protein